jgi:hypothetical protein
VLGEGAFDLRALGIHTPGEVALQASTIATFRPGALSTGVDPDNARSNPEEAAAELVMVFAVVGRIRQYGSQIHPTSGLDQRGSKVRGIIARTPADLSRKPQMTSSVAGNRELGVIGVLEESRIRAFGQVMKARVANLQPR